MKNPLTLESYNANIAYWKQVVEDLEKQKSIATENCLEVIKEKHKHYKEAEAMCPNE
jgi:hypothetical protein